MEQYAALIIFLVLVLIFFIAGRLEHRRYLARVSYELKARYGKRQEKKIPTGRMECIPAYFKEHRTDTAIDDITWSDLELDRLFEQMDLTFSAAGEEVLYHTLRTPLFDEQELKARAEQIDYFCEHKEEREKLQMLFAGMGKNGRYSLYDYLGFADGFGDGEGLKMHFLAPLWIVLAVALLFLRTEMGIFAMILAIIINTAWYFRTKGKVQPYIVTLKYVLADIVAAGRLRQLKIATCERQQKELESALAGMKGFQRGTVKLFSTDSANGDPLGLAADYINMVFHFDLIRFYFMYRKMQQHREQIDIIHGVLGYFEMLIAVGSYRTALKDICRPVFSGTEQAEAIWHPLIAEPVKNSYALHGSMLLTGSNASGKSTFLKTVAINQLLAQTLYFACADSFCTDFHRIYTSMSLRDDLENQESYFMVEIRAMQRILDAGKQDGAKIACYVDEVLRGTNTVERIAASTEILKYMAEKGFFCVAATHDIELTSLLEDTYENYHFSEEIRDGDVLFNYRLQNGKAQTRNAIRLLSVMGYEEQIVQRAEGLAETFLKEGVWQK